MGELDITEAKPSVRAKTGTARVALIHEKPQTAGACHLLV